MQTGPCADSKAIIAGAPPPHNVDNVADKEKQTIVDGCFIAVTCLPLMGIGGCLGAVVGVWAHEAMFGTSGGGGPHNSGPPGSIMGGFYGLLAGGVIGYAIPVAAWCAYGSRKRNWWFAFLLSLMLAPSFAVAGFIAGSVAISGISSNPNIMGAFAITTGAVVGLTALAVVVLWKWKHWRADGIQTSNNDESQSTAP